MNPRATRNRGNSMRNTTKKSRFAYRKKSADILKRHATQSGRDYDSYIRDDVNVFAPKPGTYVIRILPDTWEGADYFGYQCFVHYGIGADNSSYLCLRRMKNEPCPVCEERDRALQSNDEDYAMELNATQRVLVWLIDRDNEKAGPMLWSMPWTFDRDLAAMLIDRRTGEVLAIDHPDEGFDVEFTREGTKLHTQYVGKKVDRHPSPLHDDPDVAEKWLEYVVENPIPECLVYYDYDHINRVLNGGIGSSTRADRSDSVTGSRSGGSSGRQSRTRTRPVVVDEDEFEVDEDEMVDEEDTEEIEEELPFEVDDVDDEDVDEEVSRRSSRIAERFEKRKARRRA